MLLQVTKQIVTAVAAAFPDPAVQELVSIFYIIKLFL
jgi:hypothetical protein